MDSKLEISLLYDFYGELIPVSQQRVVELYVNDDLSLSEVAGILGISRQGVRDSLARAMAKLRAYEARLGLKAAYDRRRRSLEAITADVRAIMTQTRDDEIVRRCADILRHTDEMTDTNS